MPKIGIFFAPANKRSKIIAQAMSEGLLRLGIPHRTMSSLHVPSGHDFDVVLHYGLAQNLRTIFNRQREKRKAFYIDLGYWGRRKKSRWDGFHKIALNDRHPTAYFQKTAHTDHRFRQFGIQIKKWRKSGRHVLLAGMSDKAAAQEGYQPHQWEIQMVEDLRKITDRPIVYRPKPNWLGARPITGTIWGGTMSLEDSLVNCHAVVTHHSNVAIDAILGGVPAICPLGVASAISAHDIAELEDLPLTGGRKQWAADIAWTQWSVEEMASGACYRYLQDEGLIA
jgi:hypothetical protein